SAGAFAQKRGRANAINPNDRGKIRRGPALQPGTKKRRRGSTYLEFVRAVKRGYGIGAWNEQCWRRRGGPFWRHSADPGNAQLRPEGAERVFPAGIGENDGLICESARDPEGCG